MIETKQTGKKVVVRHTRRATAEEKLQDPEAVDMVEVVTIIFDPVEPPKMSFNRDLCAKEDD